MTQLRNSHNTTIKRLNRSKKFASLDHDLNSESLIKNVYTAILKFKTIYITMWRSTLYLKHAYRNFFTFFQCTCLFHNKIISNQHLTYSLYSYVSITMMINSSAPINLYRMVNLNNLILCFRNIHFQLAAVKQCFFLSSSSLFFFHFFLSVINQILNLYLSNNYYVIKAKLTKAQSQ